VGEQKRRYSARDGIERFTVYDDGKLHVAISQDVEPILDSIARDREIMRNNGDNKLLGRLPAIVVENLIRRGIYDDPDAFDRWWNTVEANPWRIWKGRV
jgi:hypothetical protein